MDNYDALMAFLSKQSADEAAEAAREDRRPVLHAPSPEPVSAPREEEAGRGSATLDFDLPF